MYYTVGLDVGCDSVKTVLVQFDNNGSHEKLILDDLNKFRKRNLKKVVQESYERVLALHKLRHEDIAYVATTGEGEMVDFRRGHFYSMTAHARGAIHLNPDVRAVVDCGALHAKAMLIDERSKVISYRMTSQCASGSGQFLENIARYLGVAIDDVGELSLQSEKPETVSGICAVLAETDVINMVSREISTANILKGIHLSMAARLVNLLRMVNAEGKVLITGGLAKNIGFVSAMQELSDQDKRLDVQIVREERSIFAGAIGAAIWGGFRHQVLSAKDRKAVAV